MAEQPSAAPRTSDGTTGRAVIMLLCLIALPLVALRGATWSELTKALPERAKKLVERHWPSDSAVVKDTRSESPRYLPDNRVAQPPEERDDASVAGFRRKADLARYDSTVSPDMMPRRLEGPPLEGAVRGRPIAPEDSPEPSLAPRFNSSLEQPPAESSPEGRGGSAPMGADNGLADPSDPPTIREMAESDGPRARPDPRSSSVDAPDVRRTPLLPVARRDRNWATNVSYTDSPPLQNAVIRSEARPNPAGADSPDRFTYMVDRLRELGAVYYLLETWGSERFRFHCKMAVGGNPGYTRHFEATDRDPVQAMGKVLSEVETWRAGR